jgi:hypothetical protein
MQQLDTYPIEDFLNKARVAKKTNQKTLVMSSKEYADLYDSLAVVMTRLSGILDKIVAAPTAPAAIEVKMNGGNF